ncbi:energy coupling factor transporter S component ThiW [Macrococcoides caseolyticum]|uniref:energy coupling factor transporter S component ThiW n=1 Tax=Macrococcoides caseolyticum TaxID=69966 RepID=UPI001F4919D4|nr:energy coupling factor transporter S component ThiW [Macrococcus caseolyticus]MCE4957205.1 energy coupling factor transporter S component ThiW [Macrococcus caseolyticus]
MNQRTRKLTLTSILIAMNIVLSQMISIPVGPIKAYPMQHFINVLCAVLVGPWFGLAQALISSCLRNYFGMGTLFAFPGSMIGVFFAGLLYNKFKKLELAALGEWIGTGLIGSICTLPLMYIMQLDFKGFMPIFYAFLLNSFIGSIIAYFLLKLLKQRKLLKN